MQQQQKPKLEIMAINRPKPVAVEAPAPAPVEQKSKAKKKITIVPTGKAVAPADGKKKILVPVGKGKGNGKGKTKGKQKKQQTYHKPDGKQYQAIAYLSGTLSSPIVPPVKGPAVARLTLEDGSTVKCLVRGRKIGMIQKLELPHTDIWIAYPAWRQPGLNKDHEQVYEVVAWKPATEPETGTAIVRGNLTWMDTENGFFFVRIGRNQKQAKGKDHQTVRILGVLPESVKRWEFVEVRCSIIDGLLQYQGMIEGE